MKILLYTRDDGPVGFSIQLPYGDAHLNNWPCELLKLPSGPTRWFWASGRNRPLPVGSPYAHVPEKRFLTELTEESAPLLIEDFREIDVDEYGRALAFLGVSTSDKGPLRDNSAMRNHLTRFTGNNESLIQLVLLQFGDSPIYIFCPKGPSVAALGSLEALGVLPTAITAVHPYQKMRRVRLELQVDWIIHLVHRQNSIRP